MSKEKEIEKWEKNEKKERRRGNPNPRLEDSILHQSFVEIKHSCQIYYGNSQIRCRFTPKYTPHKNSNYGQNQGIPRQQQVKVWVQAAS